MRIKPTTSLIAVGATAALAVGVSSAVAHTSSKVRGHQAAATTISLVTQNTLQPAFEALVKNFEAAYPSITVDATYLPSDQFNTLISTQLASGGGPDLFPAFPGTGAIPSIRGLAAQGELANLTKQPWASTVPKDAVGGLTVKHKLYSWPMGQTTYLLLYNRAIMNKLHLTPPATYKQLNADCGTIKAAGYTPVIQAGAVSPNNGILAVELAGNTVFASDPQWNAQRAAGKTTFAKTPGWTTALQEIAKMQSAGCFESDAQGVTVPQAVTSFATGQAAMWVGTAQNIGLAKAANPGIKLAVAAIPAPTAAAAKTTKVMTAYPNDLVVNAHSQNLAAAEKFVAFAATLRESRVWASAAGYIAPQDAVAGKVPADIASLAKYYRKGRTIVNPIFGWTNGAPFQTLSTDVQGLFTGQETPGKILSDVDSSWPSS